jgi:hypothetical protein
MRTSNDDKSQKPRRRRAPATGRRLTIRTAALANGMVLRGDPIHSVSNYFGVNPARIYDFPDIAPAPFESLPAPGPYLPPCAVSEVEAALASARSAIDMCTKLLEWSSQPESR